MPIKRSPYTSGDSVVDAAIAQLLTRVKDSLDRRLLAELMSSVYRLSRDEASTGDLKILNTALKELRYAFTVFRPYRHIRKVAMFGSARLTRQHPSYGMATEFGRLMAEAGWMVITGAASGIMKAGHEGAGRSASFGLNIRLPFEQEANPIIARDQKLINCKYFFTRKLLFLKESHATVLFPGGFGTLDEGFESLTLMQTGKSDPRPIVFVETPRENFWKPLLQFFDRQLIAGGMVSSDERSIYRVAHSPQEAVRIILQFYGVYHSLRYVGDRLVVRLQRPLSAGALAQLNREFTGLLSSGVITQGSALPEEGDEPERQRLPRLILRFDRQQYGRLVDLVTRINELGADSSPRAPLTRAQRIRHTNTA